jgi:hypothetical protein
MEAGCALHSGCCQRATTDCATILRSAVSVVHAVANHGRWHAVWRRCCMLPRSVGGIRYRVITHARFQSYAGRPSLLSGHTTTSGRWRRCLARLNNSLTLRSSYVSCRAMRVRYRTRPAASSRLDHAGAVSCDSPPCGADAARVRVVSCPLLCCVAAAAALCCAVLCALLCSAVCLLLLLRSLCPRVLAMIRHWSALSLSLSLALAIARSDCRCCVQ